MHNKFNTLREMSWRFVEARGLSRNDELPLLGDLSIQKAESVIASRLLCMHATAAVAFGFDSQLATNWLETEGLASMLSSTERAFIMGDIRQLFAVQNQVYSIHALTWCCGQVDDLCLLTDLPANLVHRLPDLKLQESKKKFVGGISLRSLDEVVGFLDQTYCLHWALRDAQLRLSKHTCLRWLPSVVAQRHALEWVVSDEKWDEVSLDT